MWLDALALLVLGAFAGIGALRGALASAMSILALLAAYGAAIAAAPLLGSAAAERFGVSAWVGPVIAGTGAFLAVFLGMSVLGAFLRRIEGRRGEARSARDRFLGGAFGAARGALVVLLLCVLASWLDALRVTGAAPAMPSVEGSRAAALTSSAVESGVEAALGEEGRWVARVAARPGPSAVRIQAVLDNPRVHALRDDGVFWSRVEQGAVDAALHRASFAALARDDALRAQLAELGAIDESAAADPRAFADEVARVLGRVGGRLRDLRRDPALAALLEDPEVVGLLQSGDTLGLVRHEGFRDLVARVAAPSES